MYVCWASGKVRQVPYSPPPNLSKHPVALTLCHLYSHHSGAGHLQGSDQREWVWWSFPDWDRLVDGSGDWSRGQSVARNWEEGAEEGWNVQRNVTLDTWQTQPKLAWTPPWHGCLSVTSLPMQGSWSRDRRVLLGAPSSASLLQSSPSSPGSSFTFSSLSFPCVGLVSGPDPVQYLSP